MASTYTTHSRAVSKGKSSIDVPDLAQMRRALIEARLESIQNEVLDGFTTRDLADKNKVSTRIARGIIRNCTIAGKAVVIGSRRSVTKHGRIHHAPVYRFND